MDIEQKLPEPGQIPEAIPKRPGTWFGVYGITVFLISAVISTGMGSALGSLFDKQHELSITFLSFFVVYVLYDVWRDHLKATVYKKEREKWELSLHTFQRDLLSEYVFDKRFDKNTRKEVKRWLRST